MKTLQASQLVKQLEDQIHEYGDLPVVISDGQGELALGDSAIRFSNQVGLKKKRADKEMETLQGRFFIISDL